MNFTRRPERPPQAEGLPHLASAGFLTLILEMALFLGGCGRYREFTLPLQGVEPPRVSIEWNPTADPVLTRGAAGEWDSGDVLNPSVIRTPDGYLNLYSGFDGKSWRTGLATSPDGMLWHKAGPVLAPSGNGDGYIAANGSVVVFKNELLYCYQSGRTPRILLARGPSPWRTDAVPILLPGPRGSWDEEGVADPYMVESGGSVYMYYLGMDRARRQRLGVAVSSDAVTWHKLRSNPILELGGYGAFDENGLGEPAVWSMHGSYWMLYTGRARSERRQMGIASSIDGVHWTKLPNILTGDQPWNAQTVCDPTVIVEGDRVRVWFGGGDVARPDENIHGQIGYGELSIRPVR